MKLYYLFLLMMFFLMEGCTSKSNHYDSYSDKYEYKMKKDTTKHRRHNDYYYMNNHTYSNNSGISSSPYSSSKSYKKSKSYRKPSNSYRKKSYSSYRSKSYSGSRRSHSTRTRSRRR